MRLDRDLQDEVDFHIDMRANEYQKAGMSEEQATHQARQQFGDIDSVMAEMRKERLTSMAMLCAMTALVVAVVVVWLTQQRIANTDLRMPVAPAAPAIRDPDRPSGTAPPPPPRGRGYGNTVAPGEWRQGPPTRDNNDKATVR